MWPYVCGGVDKKVIGDLVLVFCDLFLYWLKLGHNTIADRLLANPESSEISHQGSPDSDVFLVPHELAVAIHLCFATIF